jgi:hypothetical protein
MISNRDYISMDVGQNLDIDSTDSTKAATMAHVGSWFIGNPRYSMVHQHVSSCFHMFAYFSNVSKNVIIFGYFWYIP